MRLSINGLRFGRSAPPSLSSIAVLMVAALFFCDAPAQGADVPNRTDRVHLRNKPDLFGRSNKPSTASTRISLRAGRTGGAVGGSGGVVAGGGAAGGGSGAAGSGSGAAGSGSKGDGNKATNAIDTKNLCQHWVNSYEEEDKKASNPTVHIFRPAASREFPRSRFRMVYKFTAKGTCEWLYLSPTDMHRFKKGKWMLDRADKTLLKITADGVTSSYRIVELTKGILRLTPLGKR